MGNYNKWVVTTSQIISGLSLLMKVSSLAVLAIKGRIMYETEL